MSKLAELKPCPFCGGKQLSFNNAYGVCWLTCTDCGCEGPDGYGEAEAIEAWNRRAGDTNA